MYLYFSQKANQKNSDELVLQCMNDYLARMHPDRKIPPLTVAREKGLRPCIPQLPDLCFSVSHSGSCWGCLVGLDSVGFDMEDLDRKQLERFHNPQRKIWEKVAKRYFSESEFHYVKTCGEEGFFRLWVRKEALLKCEGTGLVAGLSEEVLTAEGYPADQAGDKVFYETNLRTRVIGVCCASECSDPPEIIVLD